MREKFVVLVDDDPDVLALHELYLQQGGFKTLLAHDGQAALTLVAQHTDTIGLIVSDVGMPIIDGYTLCKQVREQFPKDRLPFIFVSGLTTLEEKLRGYAAGGDDYIEKPVEPDILKQKVLAQLEHQELASVAAQRLSESVNAAMQAMTYSSQLGQVLEFFKKSMAAACVEDLAHDLFEFLSDLGLRATVQFHTPRGIVNIGDRGEVSPLEANVIELARQRGRFYDFGTRTVVNYPDYSILIKNMPVDNPELYGTLKDTLGNLCEAIDARVRALITEDRRKQRDLILHTIQQAMTSLSASLQSIQHKNVAAIDTMINDIDDAMMTLGLAENQEENIRAIATRTLKNIEQSFARGNQLKVEFQDVQQRLISLLD